MLFSLTRSKQNTRMFTALFMFLGLFSKEANSDHSNVTGYTPNFAVRLINPFGNNSREGRLEIYYSGIWGTVCDEHFTNESARVACASLGFGYIGTAIGNKYENGTGQIWLDDVNCTGTESGIHQCPHSAWGVHNCQHSEDVSIRCGNTQDFAVRLINPFDNNSKEGRLEIYYSGIWGTVCDDLFTDISARVACASLGYGYVGTVIQTWYGSGTGKIWLDNVNCTGTESSIQQCAHNQWGVHNCAHNEDIAISCGFTTKTTSTTTTYRPVCVSGFTGRISSPNFPLAYANNLNLINCISVPSGYTVIIMFLAFEIESNDDWVTITCESGNAFRPLRYSGFEFPPVLTISSCTRVNVLFRTDGLLTYTGFSLTYNITSDTVIGGIITKPSNAFVRSDKYNPVIFKCTSATKYFPWWTISPNSSTNYTITNSSCGVITSEPYSFWFLTETLGPGSCNLILLAHEIQQNLLTCGLVCTDSTLASAGALIIPIKIGLHVTKTMDSSSAITDIVRGEEIKISCTPSFIVWNLKPALVLTYFIYSGGPAAQIRILRTYWTSEGSVVPSVTFSDASSYVLVKAPAVEIPPYTCNIVCAFFSNISDISGGYSIEISNSTEPINVLFKEDDTHQLNIAAIILGALFGVSVLIIVIILAILLIRKCRRQKTNTTSDAGHAIHVDEQELQQRSRSNRYEIGYGNVVDE